MRLSDAERFARTRLADHGAEREPFVLGFLHGVRNVGGATVREMLDYAMAEVAVLRFSRKLDCAQWAERYLNGHDDGLARDATRIAMMAHERTAAA